MAAPTILVVDDQPINVQLLKRKLEREGIQVSAAYNGAEALQLVKSVKPDLILLDVMMPDMDGIEVCQRLQSEESTRSIPIIFVTGVQEHRQQVPHVLARSSPLVDDAVDDRVQRVPCLIESPRLRQR